VLKGICPSSLGQCRSNTGTHAIANNSTANISNSTPRRLRQLESWPSPSPGRKHTSTKEAVATSAAQMPIQQESFAHRLARLEDEDQELKDLFFELREVSETDTRHLEKATEEMERRLDALQRLVQDPKQKQLV